MTNRALAKLYEVPDVKGKKTTGKDELQYLYDRTGDPIFGNVIKLREFDNVLNNYIPHWAPGADGRVHTTWGFIAASGQLDSRDPNILNASKHTDLGQRFRRTLVAPSGYMWVELDKKSFHVATLGYLANDPTYIRFSQLDPHSIFTSYIMPPEWGEPIDLGGPDSDIRLQCKIIKTRSALKEGGIDLREHTAKPCVLGNQLGLGPRKLYRQNRKAIRNEEHARELQGKLDERFPIINPWKDCTIRLADTQGFLRDDWGKKQRFYEVMRWALDKQTGKWKRVRTDQAEKVLAFSVQGTAFGMLKYEHLQMEPKGYNERYNFVNSIHDSLLFLPRITDVSRCIADVGPIMNSPCSRLVNDATGPAGLLVRVEVTAGRNLAKYNKLTNPEGMREV